MECLERYANIVYLCIFCSFTINLMQQSYLYLYRDTQQDLFNAMGSMYSAILFIGITNGTAVQPVVSVERFVSYRERAAGMYSALCFAFAQVFFQFVSYRARAQVFLLTKCLEPTVFHKFTNALSSIVQVVIEFPYVFAQAIIYSSIFYSMGSFVWTVDRFIWYLFFMYLTMLYFTFYGMMTTAVTPNHHVAAIIGAPCYMLWNLFSGFMIPHKVWKLMLYCFHFQFQSLSTIILWTTLM